MNKYKDILKEHHVKATYQRIKILQYLDEHRTHPTIDEIYEALVKENPSFSKTTVYNTVDLLKKEGVISTLSITGKEVRLDYEIGGHYHFLCQNCGSIYDLMDMDCPYHSGDKIKGHRINEVHSYLIGTCKQCLSSAKKKK